MGENHTNARWFRSAPDANGYTGGNVDAEAGILHDVVMVQEGPAKGHGVHLEAEFIQELIAYDRRHFSKTGLKARFGHPTASGDTMGTQMGVFKNFRVREQDGVTQGIADLHLLSASEESPTHPGMRSWAIKMAEERPDFIMSSIVFQPSGFYQRSPGGKKKRMSNPYDDLNPELGEVFVEFGADGRHFYTDIVEAGAATDSLFSAQVNPHLYVAQADLFFQDHPHILEFIKTNPDKVQAFLATWGVNIYQPQSEKMGFSISKWLAGDDQDETKELAEVRTALLEAKDTIAEYKRVGAEQEAKIKELSEKLDELGQTVSSLQKDIADKDEKIVELSKQPGDHHTGGDTPGGDKKNDTKMPVWEKFRQQYNL